MATKGRAQVKEPQRSLLPAIGRLMETFGRAEGAVKRGKLDEEVVLLAAMERDAGGNATAMARALRGLDDLEEVRRAIDEATFEGLVGRGRLPRHNRRAGWRYYRDELDEWLKAG